MTKSDVSYPRTSAVRILQVPPERDSLDELARRMSLHNQEESVSVRDHTIRPVMHSGTWLRGERVGSIKAKGGAS